MTKRERLEITLQVLNDLGTVQGIAFTIDAVKREMDRIDTATVSKRFIINRLRQAQSKVVCIPGNVDPSAVIDLLSPYADLLKEMEDDDAE